MLGKNECFFEKLKEKKKVTSIKKIIIDFNITHYLKMKRLEYLILSTNICSIHKN